MFNAYRQENKLPSIWKKNLLLLFLQSTFIRCNRDSRGKPERLGVVLQGNSRLRGIGLLGQRTGVPVRKENKYSKRLKSERSDFGILENRSVAKQFGFQTFNLYYIYKPNVPFSDILTKLDHFI